MKTDTFGLALNQPQYDGNGPQADPRFDREIFREIMSWAEFQRYALVMQTPRVTPDEGLWVRCEAYYSGKRAHEEWVYERHHLRPKAWGGPVPLRMTGLHVVWEPLCASCHNAIHMVLDEAMRTGKLPTATWCRTRLVKNNRLKLARRGWNLHLQAIASDEVPVPAWWPINHDKLPLPSPQ